MNLKMDNEQKDMITVEARVVAGVEKVWKFWTEPGHISQWNFASSDWQCPSATNDLRVGGRFSARMEAKDGSAGFDFGGTYTEVGPEHKIVYVMDGENARRVEVLFSADGDGTKVTETFEAETENSVELQRMGWQSILENFKKHVESL